MLNKSGMLTIYVPKSDRKLVERFQELCNVRRQGVGPTVIEFIRVYVHESSLVVPTESEVPFFTG